MLIRNEKKHFKGASAVLIISMKGVLHYLNNIVRQTQVGLHTCFDDQ